PYYDKNFLDRFVQHVRDQNAGDLSFDWYPHNAPGQWMHENTNVPGTVITEPITLPRIADELNREKYGYVVISTYLSGYQTFTEIAKYVRKTHPDVKVIATSVGALIAETQTHADHIVRGNQVDDLRRIIGQPVTDPLKPVTIPAETKARFHGIEKHGNYALLVSSFGCMYGCDMCPSTAQFGHEYSSPFSPTQIRDSILAAHDSIAPESKVFTVSLAEPQGLGDIRTWKEVFRITRDLPFQVNLVSTTSSKVLAHYSIEELTQGALRLSTVNIGVESLLQGYKKNERVDLKKQIASLQDAGINAVCTFLVGLDWHSKENIKEEVRLLKNLDASGYIVANLEMQPGTPLYARMKQKGRLLNVPPELLAFYGYQAYTHPNFASGFTDMLPILENIESELAYGTRTFSANANIFLKRTNRFDKPVQKQMQTILNSFREGIDLKQYTNDVSVVVDSFTAELFYHLAFRQMDLFHPFILSTN
ncbi:MAG: hypothetical protein NTY06_04400, partial [Candidatus Gottesmanbacteria bacterium]|nr:hypothetical protein [Candidatus Gottesmanbacteria bacterium]